MDTLFTEHLALQFETRWWQASGADRQAMVEEAAALIESHKDVVTLRGAYITEGFRADTDLFLWMHAPRVEALQDLQLKLRKTALGGMVRVPWSFVGMSHSAEFNPDHIPSFVRGVPPRTYLCFYPYIRTADWYLLPREERAAMLKEHGETGREYPGILTNGVYNFGLGDYEWLLSFESEDLRELVNCLRRMRDTQARRYTKHEWPFIVGRRLPLAQALHQFV
ncbi:MAG: chlorite dismutase family protein [Alicyclobacillus sp.]|nr:chlorite dismutase family protein [Alicyclobacillus sp.]